VQAWTEVSLQFVQAKIITISESMISFKLVGEVAVG